jgi:hypothetical protein
MGLSHLQMPTHIRLLLYIRFIKIQYLRMKRSIGLVVLLFLIQIEIAFAQGDNLQLSKIKLPLRFDASILALTSNNSLTGFKEDYGIDGYGAGATLELPMPGIHSMLGITGVMGLDIGESDNADAFFLLGAYTGISLKAFDIQIGPCIGALAKNLKGDYSAPDDNIDYIASLKGGFIGLRRTFTGAGFVGMSIGIKGFYMTGSKYDKEVVNGGSKVKTVINEDAASYGGLIELAFSIGQQRKSDGWGLSIY